MRGAFFSCAGISSPADPRTKFQMTEEDKDHSERVPALRDAILSSKGCPRDPSLGDVRHIPIDTPEFLLRFLVCAKGDVDKSVARHNHYWEVRGELFSVG